MLVNQFGHYSPINSPIKNEVSEPMTPYNQYNAT
jgi:hypothetical protein